MPIIYVHGVATRNEIPDPTIVGLMKGYLSDVISPGRDVEVVYSYWGDVGAKFAWGGAARPRSPLRGQGGEVPSRSSTGALIAAELSDVLRGTPSAPIRLSDQEVTGAALTPSGVGSGQRRPVHKRLSELSPDMLSDFVSTVLILEQTPTDNLDQTSTDNAGLIMTIDEIAHDPKTHTALKSAEDTAEEWKYFARAVEDKRHGGLAGQGASAFERAGHRIRESLDRGSSGAGYVATRLVAELRPQVNDLAANFIGDVFEYLGRRGSVQALGPIPERFIASLERAQAIADQGEPIVVISHSMGGQIVYDAVTSLLPNIADSARFRIDYWCATASQIGLFEELKLFLASSQKYCTGSPVPFPDSRYLGGWWNVWDHNDFLSFTVKGIVADVDDEPFDSGMSLASAHSGYLVRPSFYRKLASKLLDARRKGWNA